MIEENNFIKDKNTLQINNYYTDRDLSDSLSKTIQMLLKV